jgi:DNA polymerase-1
VGEAPAATEARRGKPFVGPSGKVLDRAMADAGLDRRECYVTNATCCCGPSPKAREIALCRDRLLTELELVAPNVVLALGNAALRALLGRGNVSRARGAAYRHDGLGCLVVPSYHPAMVLRSPAAYHDLVSDIRLAVALLEGGGTVVVKPAPDVVHEVVCDAAGVERTVAKALESQGPVAVDVETASDGSLLCVGLSWEEGRAAVITGDAAMSCATLLDQLFASRPLVFHNAQFDLQVLWRNGMPSARTGGDTMLLCYCLDERKGKHSLADAIREHLNVPDHKKPMDKYMGHMEDAPRNELYRYNALDAAYTLILHRILSEKVDDDGRRVLRTLLYPASDVLAKMTAVGVMVDLDYLRRLSADISHELVCLEEEMHRVAGKVFNPRSHAQLKRLLYDELALPIPVDLGNASTDEEHLEFLAPLHSLPGMVLAYRKRHKFLTTYVRAMLKWADAGGRVHTTFNIGGTVTGRLSSSRPNLQNIGRSKEARDMFVATPGWTMVECDMAQSEIRVLAWLSQDENLIRAISSGVDIHTANAALMFGVRPEEVTKELRQAAKHLNFGIIYQMSAPSLAKELGVSVERAEELIRMFFAAFPRAYQWIEDTKEEVRRTGKLRTPFGRVRRFGYVTKDNEADVMREAVNFPVQSVSSDITLGAVIRLGKRLWDDPSTRLLLTVHDSILLETTSDQLTIARMVAEEMVSSAPDTTVPFIAEAKVGIRWGSLEEIAL